MRPSCADVAILAIVGQSQLANEAVPADLEVPHAVRHRASDLSAGDATADDAHPLLLPVHDPVTIERQAVAHVDARNVIHDDLILAGRRTLRTPRSAAPDANGIRCDRLAPCTAGGPCHSQHKTDDNRPDLSTVHPTSSAD